MTFAGPSSRRRRFAATRAGRWPGRAAATRARPCARCPARLFRARQREQHVAAQVDVVRVVGRRAHEVFVVRALGRRDGLDVRHERPRPQAVPREADGGVERGGVREREDGLFGERPRVGKTGPKVGARPSVGHPGDGGTNVEACVELHPPEDFVIDVEGHELRRAGAADVGERPHAVVARSVSGATSARDRTPRSGANIWCGPAEK